MTGPNGLLKQLTKTVLETALNQEMTEHLGHEKHGSPEPGSGNVRNGTRSKTVLTEASGEVVIEVPRDRAGTFEPQIGRDGRVQCRPDRRWFKGLSSSLWGAITSSCSLTCGVVPGNECRVGVFVAVDWSVQDGPLPYLRGR